MSHVLFYSDTMGNKGAFIKLKGSNMIPKFTTYKAVVSNIIYLFSKLLGNIILNIFLQPHPDVKPMAYANSLFSLMS